MLLTLSVQGSKYARDEHEEDNHHGTSQPFSWSLAVLMYEHISFMTFLKILRTIQLRKFDKADSMQRCFLSAKPELFNHKQANLKTSSVKIKSKILTTMTQKIDCKVNVLNLRALLREMQFAGS